MQNGEQLGTDPSPSLAKKKKEKGEITKKNVITKDGVNRIPTGPFHPTDCLSAPISVYSEHVFGTSRNSKITDSIGKRSSNVQT